MISLPWPQMQHPASRSSRLNKHLPLGLASTDPPSNLVCLGPALPGSKSPCSKALKAPIRVHGVPCVNAQSWLGPPRQAHSFHITGCSKTSPRKHEKHQQFHLHKNSCLQEQFITATAPSFISTSSFPSHIRPSGIP